MRPIPKLFWKYPFFGYFLGLCSEEYWKYSRLWIFVIWAKDLSTFLVVSQRNLRLTLWSGSVNPDPYWQQNSSCAFSKKYCRRCHSRNGGSNNRKCGRSVESGTRKHVVNLFLFPWSVAQQILNLIIQYLKV